MLSRTTALALCLAIAACTAPPPRAVGAHPAPAPAATSPATASSDATSPAATSPATASSDATGPAATRPGAPPTDGVLQLAFAGDVHFAAQLAARLERPETALRELGPHLAAADVAVLNLETALTDRGAPAPKRFHFRAPAAALDAVAGAGVDVVTMANNHAVDYGADGLEDTLAARAASPLPVVGVGRDEDDAFRPAVLSVDGQEVAVLGATQVPDWTAAHAAAGRDRPGVAVALDPAPLARAVRRARRVADVVVVYLHWGTDYTTCPNPAQRRTARLLADAGADVVVGTHAHQVQGSGWLGRTYVAYGLGNFVWWRRNSPAESASGVLTLTVRGRRVVTEQWQPLRVSPDGIPREPDEQQARALLADWERARRCSGLAAAPG